MKSMEVINEMGSCFLILSKDVPLALYDVTKGITRSLTPLPGK